MPEVIRRPMPPWQTDGVPNFPHPVHWLTFDAMKGVLVCRAMKTEIADLLCFIVHANLVRTLCAPGGQVICASDNREKPSFGRRDRWCASCEERDGPCRLRWRIWVKEIESNALFAHTLSVTASANFARYGDRLREKGRLPSEVVTNVFVEPFRRKNSNLMFRRLQFAQVCADEAT